MGSNLAVGLIMVCLALTGTILGVEALLKWFISRRVKKITKDFDKIMDEIEKEEDHQD
jgi:hypothetical protein